MAAIRRAIFGQCRHLVNARGRAFVTCISCFAVIRTLPYRYRNSNRKIFIVCVLVIRHVATGIEEVQLPPRKNQMSCL